MLDGRDRDRLKVLHQVVKKQITQAHGAAQLQLSVRWVKKLVRRMRKEGDGGLIHRLRGKPSNRKMREQTQRKATALMNKHYADYGPTQAGEMLSELHGITVSRETTRKWMTEAGLWKPTRTRIEKVHVWRRRRCCRGELVQWDTSEHDWLEGRGPRLYLIAMIDDATSELTARFAPHDSTEENMRLMWQYLELHGRPGEYYTDKAGLFQINRPLHYNQHLAEEPGKTQIGRALEELAIGWIAAHSPQAKGRIERCFGTLQDRLVKALRRGNVNTLARANQFLWNTFLPEWNRRFTVEPANAADAHRPLRENHSLAASLSHVETRQIGNDYTVSWLNQRHQIPYEQVRPRMKKATVRIEQRLDGTVVANWEGEILPLHKCTATLKTVHEAPSPLPRKPRKPRTKSRWMDGFQLPSQVRAALGVVPAPVALRAPSAGTTPE